MGAERFEGILQETQTWERQRDVLLVAQSNIQHGQPLSNYQRTAVTGARKGISATDAAMASLLGGADDGDLAGGDSLAITAYLGYIDKQISNNVGRMYSISPETAYEIYPDYLGENADQVKKTQALLGGGGGGDSYHPPVQAYNFSIGPGGDIVRTNSVTGAVELTGMKVPQGSQVITNTRDGHAYAINIDNGDRVDLGVVAFPDIDPEKKFRFDVLATAANLEQSMAGIELQKRGQVLKAIGDDFANQVALGRMVYDEAQLNLDRVDRAFTQRREERAQLLKYAVAKSSLRMRNGQEMTALPFGNQIAGILSAATGRQFTADQFELPTTYISPEQAAADVINSSGFTSPIPGLSASLGDARERMDAILGAPLGSQAATEQIMKMAIPGA